MAPQSHGTDDASKKFNTNRFIDLALSSQHNPDEDLDEAGCWRMLEEFAETLNRTASKEELKLTNCVVGIDIDDRLFYNELARERISTLLPCQEVIFVDIHPILYGQLCKIWNLLAQKARNDFVVLLGDDVRLLDRGWQERIVRRFHDIAEREGIPFGAACVAMKDLSFPGFATIPVLHRWHLQHFGSLLPKQFANQGVATRTCMSSIVESMRLLSRSLVVLRIQLAATVMLDMRSITSIVVG
jgi:hypothetical protein